MELRFWGVRGSIASPQEDTVGYGGNTACVEIRGPGDEVVVIDGGTGARRLGAALAAEFRGRRLVVHYLLTHFHSDHIQGLPFFEPLYDASAEVIFYSASAPDYTRNVLEGQMAGPYFPVPFSQVAARTGFVQLREGPASIGTLSVLGFPLHHPQGATGFRVEDGSTVMVHASDLEHGHPKLDAVLREHARDADVLIYDAQFTPEEYERRRGWGHSTWVEATRVAREAGVQRLVLFHHDPSRSDAAVDALVDQARQMFDHTSAAREWRRGDKVIETDERGAPDRTVRRRDPGSVPERAPSAETLSHVRHQLRTPLHHIVGYSEMLLEEMVDRGETALAADLMAVRAASERLLDTFTRMLSTAAPDWSTAVLREPLQTILDRTGRLALAASARAEASWERDLGRIREAARQLDAFLDSLGASGPLLPEPEPAPGPAGLVTDVVPVVRPQTMGGLVLVVDDNDSNLDMLSRRLERAGHLVATADSGLRALELLHEHPFDVVLLDVTMPEMDGFQVLQHLKDDRSLQHLPVIMLSAFDELARVVRCIEAGADDYLSKPINVTLLNARIAACLGKKRLHDRERDLYAQLQEEEAMSERLLLNVLPAPIAARLKKGETTTIADSLADVTVLFADLVDFTRISAAMPPAELVALLGEVFSTFDDLATRRGLEKIKTIGDSYMAVGGLPSTAPDHAAAAADMALDIQEALAAIGTARGRDLRIRLGLHTGPVVAGIIWQRKYTYDLWGDTVNIASRMESQGLPGRIQISADTRARLGGRFRVEARGPIPVRGRGNMETYLLLGRSG